MTECTTNDCGNETATYLCHQCVSDLQSWIVKGWELVPELDVTIARMDVVRKAGQEGGVGGKAGSAAPMNLDAWQIKANLSAIDRDANVYARDQFAAGIATTIQGWVTNAELLVSGPEPERVKSPEELRAQLAEAVEPMTAKDCAEWLSKATGIHFTSKRIRNWVDRRGLRPAGMAESPTYRPEDVLAAYHRSERKVA